MNAQFPISPRIVAHADWSISPRKRWAAVAELSDGVYQIAAPYRVASADALLFRLADRVPALLGVDFPIGLPLAYARQVGVTDFIAWLPAVGEPPWHDFFRVAAVPHEISLYRPFYPQRPGGTRLKHLLDALNLENADALRRLCERALPGRRAAAPLFWTMGAQQVGKAAGSGWRELVKPALSNSRFDTAIWPFSGDFTELLQHPRIVMAETYPAEVYVQLGLSWNGSKRQQRARSAHAASIERWAEQHRVRLSPQLRTALHDGFGPRADGEDPFDAVLGVIGVLNVVLGTVPAGAPVEDEIRRVEGWILGRPSPH